MIVKADECRIWIGLHQQNRGCALAAADVGDFRAVPLEERFDTVECGNPLVDQMRRVARTKEPLGALEQRRMMLMPSDSEARAEGCFEFRQAAKQSLQRSRRSPG
jgi:hypothetical protein